MKCPSCQQETKVIETRVSCDSTRRRRECLECKERFTTYERAEIELTVLKKDGGKQRFDPEKLMAGLERACEKRPVTADQIQILTKSIEQKLRQEGREVQSQRIGELAMEGLATMDEVAYIRFASVYREFNDSKSFSEEISKLKERKKEEGIRCRL